MLSKLKEAEGKNPMESETGKTGLVISKNKDEMSAGVSCFKDSTTIVSRTLLLL